MKTVAITLLMLGALPIRFGVSLLARISLGLRGLFQVLVFAGVLLLYLYVCFKAADSVHRT